MWYWIALSWWAAKWIAHIWFIKYLQEKKIKINEISWTSMWSIIASCLALNMHYNEMYNLIKNIKFIKLIDINLKTWLVIWNKVKNQLKKIFWNKKIEDLDIPLYIIATNLDTWEKKVFNSWYIVDAIMASISLPSIFKPYQIWNIKYIDWWLTDNLWISPLNSKNILAFSVIRWDNNPILNKKKFLNFELNKSFFKYNYEILYKSLNINLKSNEDLNIDIAKLKWSNVILISPDLSKFEFYDFYKYDDLIKKWYESIKSNLEYNL